MAFLERYLNRESRLRSFAWLALGALVVFASAARAQSEPPVTTFRTLALGADVAEIFYDLRGKPVPVTAVSTGLSAPCEAPPGGEVVFYRLQPVEPPGAAPLRVNVAEVRMNDAGPYLVFMAANPETPAGIRVQAVEDSWKTHPAETIRLFNFSRREIAVRIVIKDLVVELTSGQNRVLPYGASGQFWMQAATKEAEGWVMRVSAPQVGPPGARITAILFDQKPSVDRPVTHELDLIKFIDVAPPPKS